MPETNRANHTHFSASPTSPLHVALQVSLQNRMFDAINANDPTQVQTLLTNAEERLDFVELFHVCYAQPGIDEDIKIAIARSALMQKSRNAPHATEPHELFDFITPQQHLLILYEDWKLILFLLQRGYPASDLQQHAPFDTQRQKLNKLICRVIGTSYYSPKRNSINLNGAAKLPNGDSAVCRHLVAQYLLTFDPETYKPDLDQFTDIAIIQNRLLPDIETLFAEIIGAKHEHHTINNEQFGSLLHSQFVDMEQHGIAAKTMLLVSINSNPNHAMSVTLKIKTDNQGTHYVVLFYDPNHTTNHKRCTADLPAEFLTPPRKALASYLPHNSLSEITYYPDKTTNQDSVSTIHMVGVYPKHPLQRNTILHLMRQAYAQQSNDLPQNIAAYLETIPEHAQTTAIFDLLMAQDNQGNSALRTALWTKNFATISICLDLLSRLPDEQKQGCVFALFNLCHSVGNIRFLDALDKTDERIINACVELVRFVPEPQRPPLVASLLNAKNTAGYPWLLNAIPYSNNADTIIACGELLALIPESERTNIVVSALAAQSASTISPWLATMISYGRNHEAISAVAIFLSPIPADDQVNILAGLLIGNGTLGLPLFMAFCYQDIDTVLACIEILNGLPEKQRRALATRILFAQSDSLGQPLWQKLAAEVLPLSSAAMIDRYNTIVRFASNTTGPYEQISAPMETPLGKRARR